MGKCVERGHTSSSESELHGIVSDLSRHVFDIHLYVDFLWFFAVVDHLGLVQDLLARGPSLLLGGMLTCMTSVSSLM